MSQLGFCINWNPEEAGSNANDEMDEWQREGKQAKKMKAFLLPLSLHRLPAEGVAKIKGLSDGGHVRGTAESN